MEEREKICFLLLIRKNSIFTHRCSISLIWALTSYCIAAVTVVTENFGVLWNGVILMVSGLE